MKVDDAVENNPPVNPMTDEVELYPVATVNGKVELTVTAPVAPDIVTFDPATIEVTPVLVTFPFRYVKPDEKVVVAPLYTSPLVSTFSVPDDNAGNRRAELNVDEAVENNPPVNPIAVVVPLYPTAGVNGKAKVENPASLLNQDSLTDEEAMVETNPLDPVKAKP